MDNQVYFCLGCNVLNWTAFGIRARMSNDIPWSSYQICKIAGCACAGNVGNVFPAKVNSKKVLPGGFQVPCYYFFLFFQKAPGLKTPETRRRGKSDLSTTNSTWHRDIDRALSDVEMATLPAESSSGPLDTCKFETESIGPCSIAGDSHCEQENTASRRNTQTDMDSETALIPGKNYFTTDL